MCLTSSGQIATYHLADRAVYRVRAHDRHRRCRRHRATLDELLAKCCDRGLVCAITDMHLFFVDSECLDERDERLLELVHNRLEVLCFEHLEQGVEARIVELLSHDPVGFGVDAQAVRASIGCALIHEDDRPLRRCAASREVAQTSERAEEQASGPSAHDQSDESRRVVCHVNSFESKPLSMCMRERLRTQTVLSSFVIVMMSKRVWGWRHLFVKVRPVELMMYHHEEVVMASKQEMERLCEAVREKNKDQVLTLLEQGVPAHDHYHPPIQAATEANAPAMIELLVAHGADVNVLDYSGDSPLHTAINHGHVEAFDALVKAGADLYVRGSDYYGSSPLLCAIERGDEVWVRRVFEAGSDPTKHAIPLHAQAAQHAPELVDVLCELGVSLDGVNEMGQTGLTWLAHRRDTQQAVEVLLDAGADKDVLNAFGWSPAMVASAFGPRVVSSKLGRAKMAPEVVLLEALERGYLPDVQAAFADVSSTGLDYKGHTWLSWARTVEVMEWLLEQGVDPLHRGPEGETALCHVQWGEQAGVQALIDAASYLPEDLTLALGYAVRDGLEEVAKSLLAVGAVPGVRGRRSMLFDALGRGESWVKMLLEAGADANAVDATGCSLFYRAYDERRAAKIVEALLEAGADPNAQSPAGRRPLAALCASMYSDPEKKHLTCLELLLEAGAEGRSKDEYERSPFDIVIDHVLEQDDGWDRVLKTWLKIEPKAMLKEAVKQEGGDKKLGLERLGAQTDAYRLGLWIHASLPTAKKLIKAGVGRDGEQEHSPLFAAVALDLGAVVTLLLEHDFDPNVRGVYDRSLLAYAASLGRHECMTLLVEGGAQPNLDDRGDVLLWALDSPTRVETVKLLLELGADPGLRESTKTPREHAEYRLANYRNKDGLEAIIEMLSR